MLLSEKMLEFAKVCPDLIPITLFPDAELPDAETPDAEIE
jgi:hypothetical protein